MYGLLPGRSHCSRSPGSLDDVDATGNFVRHPAAVAFDTNLVPLGGGVCVPSATILN